MRTGLDLDRSRLCELYDPFGGQAKLPENLAGVRAEVRTSTVARFTDGRKTEGAADAVEATGARYGQDAPPCVHLRVGHHL